MQSVLLLFGCSILRFLLMPWMTLIPTSFWPSIFWKCYCCRWCWCCCCLFLLFTFSISPFRPIHSFISHSRFFLLLELWVRVCVPFWIWYCIQISWWRLYVIIISIYSLRRAYFFHSLSVSFSHSLSPFFVFSRPLDGKRCSKRTKMIRGSLLTKDQKICLIGWQNEYEKSSIITIIMMLRKKKNPRQRV